MGHTFRTSLVAFSLFLVGCGGAAASTSASGSATAPTSGGVKFKKKLPRVGSASVTREHNETKLEMDVTVDGVTQHSTLATDETIERRVEVLAVGADGAATRIRVAYPANHRDDSIKGLLASPVEGKTYVIEGRGEKKPSSIQDAAGHPAPAAEAEVAASDFKHLGRLDPTQRALPDRPLTVGDSLDDLAKAVFEDNASDGLEEVQIHFEGTSEVGGRPTGIFGIQLTGKISPDAPRVKMEGKFTLLVDGASEVSSDATAPLEISQRGMKDGKVTSVVAHGTLHLHKETTYDGR